MVPHLPAHPLAILLTIKFLLNRSSFPQQTVLLVHIAIQAALV